MDLQERQFRKRSTAVMLRARAAGSPVSFRIWLVKEYQPITAVIEKLAIAAGRCDDSSCTTSAV